MNFFEIFMLLTILYALAAMTCTFVLRRHATRAAMRGEGLPPFRMRDTAVSRGTGVAQVVAFVISIGTFLTLVTVYVCVAIVVLTNQVEAVAGITSPTELRVQAAALIIFIGLAAAILLFVLAPVQTIADAFCIYNYRIIRLEAEGLERSRVTLIRVQRALAWVVWGLGAGVATFALLYSVLDWGH